MAGFQVSTYGRFWVSTEVKHHGELGALVTALGAVTGVERAA